LQIQGCDGRNLGNTQKGMTVLLVKQRIIVFESPFFQGGPRGNVCDLSLARWKADSQLSIGHD